MLLPVLLMCVCHHAWRVRGMGRGPGRAAAECGWLAAGGWGLPVAKQGVGWGEEGRGFHFQAVQTARFLREEREARVRLAPQEQSLFFRLD